MSWLMRVPDSIADPAIVGGTVTYNNFEASKTCNFPSGIQSGDLLVAVVWQIGGSQPVTSGLSDFTAYTTYTDVNAWRIRIFTKIAVGNETSTTITFQGGASYNVIFLLAYRNVGGIVEHQFNYDSSSPFTTTSLISAQKSIVVVGGSGARATTGITFNPGTLSFTGLPVTLQDATAGGRGAISHFIAGASTQYGPYAMTFTSPLVTSTRSMLLEIR